MRSTTAKSPDDDPGLPGPYDGPGVEEPWFLADAGDEEGPPLSRAGNSDLVDAAGWTTAQAARAGDLAALAFDAGRLAERLRAAGQGAAHRLALEEAAALSWWTGDRIGADRLALWLSYRIGAAEEGGEGLIRTAWAARRLAGSPGGQVVELVADLLGDEGRGDDLLALEVAAALDGVAELDAVVRGCVAFHLWRSLEERPDHLRGLEAAVLGGRLSGRGGLSFLPLALTGFGALTASGSPEARLSAWIAGSHRAVLAALMALDRLAGWRTRAEAATADLSGRTPARLIAALAAHPMLAAPQAETETGASRAAIQRNLDLLLERGLIREVTGQGRFRVWAAKI